MIYAPNLLIPNELTT